MYLNNSSPIIAILLNLGLIVTIVVFKLGCDRTIKNTVSSLIVIIVIFKSKKIDKVQRKKALNNNNCIQNRLFVTYIRLKNESS